MKFGFDWSNMRPRGPSTLHHPKLNVWAAKLAHDLMDCAFVQNMKEAATSKVFVSHKMLPDSFFNTGDEGRAFCINLYSTDNGHMSTY